MWCGYRPGCQHPGTDQERWVVEGLEVECLTIQYRDFWLTLCFAPFLALPLGCLDDPKFSLSGSLSQDAPPAQAGLGEGMLPEYTG